MIDLILSIPYHGDTSLTVKNFTDQLFFFNKNIYTTIVLSVFTYYY